MNARPVDGFDPQSPLTVDEHPFVAQTGRLDPSALVAAMNGSKDPEIVHEDRLRQGLELLVPPSQMLGPEPYDLPHGTGVCRSRSAGRKNSNSEAVPSVWEDLACRRLDRPSWTAPAECRL